MKGLIFLAAPAMTLFAVPMPSATAANCDVVQVNGARELHEILSRRAVEIVERASRSSWHEDGRLIELVAPAAEFSLGAGDVGRSAGIGPSGAHALTLLMNADTFRFHGWDYMNLPVDPCSIQKIDVEFVDTGAGRSSKIEFTFEDGQVIRAAGWQRSIESGTIATPETQAEQR